jgi:hypothetical protein
VVNAAGERNPTSRAIASIFVVQRISSASVGARRTGVDQDVGISTSFRDTSTWP